MQSTTVDMPNAICVKLRVAPKALSSYEGQAVRAVCLSLLTVTHSQHLLTMPIDSLIITCYYIDEEAPFRECSE